nr:hypothetical protein [uncultured Allomuricauda sp.]
MEKLEKHIKDTLEERRIAPSSQAWDKISSQIEIPKTKSSKGWLIYSVAASFIGIILVSIFFFQKETPTQITPQIVDVESSKEKQVNPDSDKLIPLESEEDNTAIVSSKIKKKVIENPTSEQVTSAVALEETISKTVNNQPLKDGIINTPDGLIAQKVKEVAAQVALLESMNNEVSNAEIDSLLRAAQRQVLTDKIFKSDKVDAMALLTEVEDELDESFRDQIFDALKDGYFKLRTAVADRNN